MTEIPATLHHYTTASGLQGIFAPKPIKGFPNVPSERSLTLWASDARYLNDSQELSFAADALADAMLDCAAHHDAAHKARIAGLAKRIRAGDFTDPNPSIGQTAHTAYVTSFSSRADLLSQWRGYGANGYSIEFPVDILKQFLVPAFRAGNESIGFLGGSQLFPVHYKLDESIIEAAAEEIVHPTSYSSAVQNAVECLAQFKHDAFEEEQEWRLIYSAGHNYTACDFRPSPTGMLIPYLQLRLTPFHLHDPARETAYPGKLVESIWVGPSPEQELRVESVTRMLNQLSFGDVRVTHSPTPYRG
ncbi:DUF2971 domain-containing protein [Rhodococcus sp. A14]|uniref:DUF2971 domain-containing protein n=1 Tax=Rhodococcus sp. A14 TaxID=1194106 RepID=UPI00142347EF|nr:DUF2971 domain-containing protein [Rhodococcus sp. A14]